MTALLRTHAVGKAFGGVHALTDCTIDVAQGSIAGLIGPNGSGKTTLFNVISGYERADSGRVFLRDADITNAPPDKVFRCGIGRTFQLTRVFRRLTVMENMIVAARHREIFPNGSGRAPGGLRTLLARAGGWPPGGAPWSCSSSPGSPSTPARWRARCPTASASCWNCPTCSSRTRRSCSSTSAGGVNLTLIGVIADRIRDLNKAGTTFLIVEHNMDFVMGLCDRVTVIDNGTPVASGPPEMIRTDRRVLDAYLGTDDDDDDDDGDDDGDR